VRRLRSRIKRRDKKGKRRRKEKDKGQREGKKVKWKQHLKKLR